ncbi:hypothetical protein B0H14DRAFT_3480713 [Mycena olivaceomarginata]|nr:hypothetical protein B0H14DRAFT_3480713 [Mycena olivaceomarginata]
MFTQPVAVALFRQVPECLPRIMISGVDPMNPSLKAGRTIQMERGAVKLEENEEWEVEAENWKHLDDEEWLGQLQASRRKRSVTLMSNISDQEDRKRHKSSEATDETTVKAKKTEATGSAMEPSAIASTSSSTSTASSAIIMPPGPSNSSEFIYNPHPKRGFNVPKAAFDPWNSK